jgi:hypothetical protein
MNTTVTRAIDLEPGDLAVATASDGIRYTLLILTSEYDKTTGTMRFNVAESVHESTFGVCYSSRLAFFPADLLDKLEGIKA